MFSVHSSTDKLKFLKTATVRNLNQLDYIVVVLHTTADWFTVERESYASADV